MEILKTFVVSVLSFFGISTQSISTIEVQTSVIKEIQKPQPTIETKIVTKMPEKETDTKELIEEIRHKNEENIAFIKARKEQEKPKKKRQPPVKIEVQESEWERILREGKIISEMNKEREIKKKVLEKIAFDELLEKKYKEAPRKTLTLPEFGIELTYPEMDFTKIIANPDDYQKKYLKKSNILIHEKGVKIDCHMNNETPPLKPRTRPEGLDITITNMSSREYINSNIGQYSFYSSPSDPEYLVNFETLSFASIQWISVDGISGRKFKLNPNRGFEIFIPGKNYNYILKTEQGEESCEQEIIESIKFLDK